MQPCISSIQMSTHWLSRVWNVMYDTHYCKSPRDIPRMTGSRWRHDNPPITGAREKLGGRAIICSYEWTPCPINPLVILLSIWPRSGIILAADGPAEEASTVCCKDLKLETKYRTVLHSLCRTLTVYDCLNTVQRVRYCIPLRPSKLHSTVMKHLQKPALHWH